MALKNDGSAGLKDPLGLDRQSTALLQGELAWDEAVLGQGRLRIRSVVTLRWVMLACEAAALTLGAAVFALPAPYAICFGVVGLAAWINLLAGIATPGQRLLHPTEATGQLGFDILRVAGLAALTGGIANPFVVLVLPPLALAAPAPDPGAGGPGRPVPDPHQRLLLPPARRRRPSGHDAV